MRPDERNIAPGAAHASVHDALSNAVGKSYRLVWPASEPHRNLSIQADGETGTDGLGRAGQSPGPRGADLAPWRITRSRPARDMPVSRFVAEGPENSPCPIFRKTILIRRNAHAAIG
jgi:hypothetical protein